MINLSAAQVTEVMAPSRRYPAADYTAIVETAAKAKAFAKGNIEEQFPGVKPAHVAFMLKQAKGDRKDLVVDTHALYGVCLIKVAPAKAAKPKHVEKVTTKK